MNVMCWSGGKDSTASIILDHTKNGHQIDLIIISLLYFDKKRKIYAEHPEHIEFIFKAKKVFEDWGYKVVMLDVEHDYMYWFYKKRTKRCKNKDNVGKYYGFLLSGLCELTPEKKYTIDRYLKKLGKHTQYVGIAIDEPERLDVAHRGGKISLLEKFNCTEDDAKKLCEEYDLLSPVYAFTKRQGCWFCPNATIGQLQHVYETHPELWAELEKLDLETNVVSRRFKRGMTLKQIKEQFDDRKLRGCDSAG